MQAVYGYKHSDHKSVNTMPSDAGAQGSPTTFQTPIVDTGDMPSFNRTVTVYVSGKVSVDGALESRTLKLSKDDLRKAIGVGEKQYIPNQSIIIVL